MAPLKMTFSLDQDTALKLSRTAERLRISKSAVVREAVSEFAARAGKLSEVERRNALRIFDQMVAPLPKGSDAKVDQELRALAQSRKDSGRRTSID